MFAAGIVSTRIGDWNSWNRQYLNIKTAGADFSLYTSFAIARPKQVCKMLKSSFLSSSESPSTLNAEGGCSVKFYFLTRTHLCVFGKK